ncbi:MAG: UDP-2,4-diacetamido-2,4,6-trideoxy-beta-L-altropyranose hydrolase [Verrucomicrobiota bacterium]
MHIAFRVDASRQIGTGHFMRCLTLADALKERGASSGFLSRNLPKHLRGLLDLRGHALLPLAPGDDAPDGDLLHSTWLGTSQQADAQNCLGALREMRCDWLVVDHYALDGRWETPLRQKADKIFAIDDIADRNHDCDLLLDQNYYADMHGRYRERLPKSCTPLLGPKYAILRKEFINLHANSRPRPGHVERVFIFLGGVDLDNYTGVVMRALDNFRRKNLSVDIVLGAQHPCRKEICGECERKQYSVHVQTDRIGELMKAADLGIGAGGSSTWERCAVGLPTLVVAVAANQIPTAIDTAKIGATNYAGCAGDVSAELLAQEIDRSFDSSWINRASRFCLDLVDALGVQRILEQMKCYE